MNSNKKYATQTMKESYVKRINSAQIFPTFMFVC